MKYDQQTDQQLLRRFRQKADQEALGALFLRYTELMYGVCLKYLGSPEAAKDAVMDVYELLHQKLPEFEVNHFSGWLYRVCVNHCLQDIRLQKKSLTVSLDDPAMQNGIGIHPDEEADGWTPREEEMMMLEDCLGKLPDLQRVCIRWFYFQKKTYAEISELESLALDSVRSHIQNGRRNLKKCMENKQRLGSGSNI